jgi:hypothetical protein
VEFRPKVVVIGSPKLLGSSGMSSSLAILCNSRLFVIDLSYSYRYLHELYPELSDIYFMICVLYCPVLVMISMLSLELWYPFRYSYVCSNMMSVHPKGGGSARDTRVLLVNADVVSGLIKCCWMSPFPTVCRGSRQVVTALSVPCNPPCSEWGVGDP